MWVVRSLPFLVNATPTCFMLYHAYQLQNDWLGPLQSAAQWGADWLNHGPLAPL